MNPFQRSTDLYQQGKRQAAAAGAATPQTSVNRTGTGVPSSAADPGVQSSQQSWTASVPGASQAQSTWNAGKQAAQQGAQTGQDAWNGIKQAVHDPVGAKNDAVAAVTNAGTNAANSPAGTAISNAAAAAGAGIGGVGAAIGDAASKANPMQMLQQFLRMFGFDPSADPFGTNNATAALGGAAGGLGGAAGAAANNMAAGLNGHHSPFSGFANGVPTGGMVPGHDRIGLQGYAQQHPAAGYVVGGAPMTTGGAGAQGTQGDGQGQAAAPPLPPWMQQPPWPPVPGRRF